MKILPEVAAKSSWNLDRLKGKVFPAMFFSRELVDPKATLNCCGRKGMELIFSNYVHTSGNTSLVTDTLEIG